MPPARIKNRGFRTLNELFFKKLNPLSAYVFGFWMADGCIHHDKHYKITFTSNDGPHLEDVKVAMGSDTNVYQGRRFGVLQNYYQLDLYSKRLFADIIKLGGSTKKSATLKFPKVPIHLLADFIRGYFDGDGSVHIVSYKSSKNGKTYKELRSNFTCGSKKFLKSLRDILNLELQTPRKVIGQYGPHQFKLGYGTKSTNKLLEYMYYEGHGISLKRKANFTKDHGLKTTLKA